MTLAGRSAAALVLIALCASGARAEILPRPVGPDPHIQVVAYDPQDVTLLQVQPGYAVTVLFAPDERIETVSLGNTGAWQVQANRRADQLVIKPSGNAPMTNLVVITDQRRYAFTLHAGGYGLTDNPYLLSFIYPAPPAGAPAAPPAPAEAQYRMKGDRRLWPLTLELENGFTLIRWPDGVALPAVYRVESGNQLVLVNGVMRDGAYRIEGIHAELMFVLGRAKAYATRIDALDQP